MLAAADGHIKTVFKHCNWAELLRFPSNTFLWYVLSSWSASEAEGILQWRHGDEKELHQKVPQNQWPETYCGHKQSNKKVVHESHTFSSSIYYNKIGKGRFINDKNMLSMLAINIFIYYQGKQKA
jgi:hypothetical protein